MAMAHVLPCGCDQLQRGKRSLSRCNLKAILLSGLMRPLIRKAAQEVSSCKLHCTHVLLTLILTESICISRQLHKLMWVSSNPYACFVTRTHANLDTMRYDRHHKRLAIY